MYYTCSCSVVHAEPVAVGMVVKNPLGIPLLMTKFTLVWQFNSPSSSSHSPSTPLLSPKASGRSSGGDSPTSQARPAASCEVVEKIELMPNEQRMVCS